MYTPTGKIYFSGGGLMDIGLQQAGVKIVQSLDFDEKATACMKANPEYFSHDIITASIEDQLVQDQPKTDVMFFTYPCTKYSTIADIHGTRTGDALFLHAFRHIAIDRPECYVVENVPGMKKFKVVMEAMTKLPDYFVTVFCPVSADLWVPQKRDRLIIIATRKPFTPSHPVSSGRRLTIKDILEKDPVYEMPDYVVSRINGNYRDKPIVVDPENVNELAPTCVAHYSKDLGTRLVKDKNAPLGMRPFTIREYARLQGVPDDYIFKGERNDYKIIGNGVATPVGRWAGEQVMKYFN